MKNGVDVIYMVDLNKYVDVECIECVIYCDVL